MNSVNKKTMNLTSQLAVHPVKETMRSGISGESKRIGFRSETLAICVGADIPRHEQGHWKVTAMEVR
jgi:hypothetical protein